MKDLFAVIVTRTEGVTGATVYGPFYSVDAALDFCAKQAEKYPCCVCSVAPMEEMLS